MLRLEGFGLVLGTLLNRIALNFNPDTLSPETLNPQSLKHPRNCQPYNPTPQTPEPKRNRACRSLRTRSRCGLASFTESTVTSGLGLRASTALLGAFGGFWAFGFGVQGRFLGSRGWGCRGFGYARVQGLGFRVLGFRESFRLLGFPELFGGVRGFECSGVGV